MDGDLVGIHYPSLEAAARMSDLCLDRHTFDKVQVLEKETIDIVRRRELNDGDKT